MIFRNPQGKVIGNYDTTNHTFTKTVRKSVHKVREPAGWAVDVGVIDTLSLIGCETIQIIEKEEKTTYTIPFETFTKNGILISRGYGDQILVVDKNWESHPTGAHPVKSDKE